jgi:hypothetical protein
MAGLAGMRARGIAAILTCAALTACAGERQFSGVETQGGASVNVFPEKYRDEILAYQRSYLNDPTGIRSAGITQPALRKVGSVERYVVCVRFSAKAPAGGYTGVRDQLVIFLSGKLDQMGPTREQCKDAAYEPFPELERLTR